MDEAQEVFRPKTTADRGGYVRWDANGPTAAAEGASSALSHGYQYDLVVVGGGSGGLACSKKAAQLGAKVSEKEEDDAATHGSDGWRGMELTMKAWDA